MSVVDWYNIGGFVLGIAGIAKNVVTYQPPKDPLDYPYDFKDALVHHPKNATMLFPKPLATELNPLFGDFMDTANPSKLYLADTIFACSSGRTVSLSQAAEAVSQARKYAYLEEVLSPSGEIHHPNIFPMIVSVKNIHQRRRSWQWDVNQHVCSNLSFPNDHQTAEGGNYNDPRLSQRIVHPQNSPSNPSNTSTSTNTNQTVSSQRKNDDGDKPNTSTVTAFTEITHQQPTQLNPQQQQQQQPVQPVTHRSPRRRRRRRLRKRSYSSSTQTVDSLHTNLIPENPPLHHPQNHPQNHQILSQTPFTYSTQPIRPPTNHRKVSLPLQKESHSSKIVKRSFWESIQKPVGPPNDTEVSPHLNFSTIGKPIHYEYPINDRYMNWDISFKDGIMRIIRGPPTQIRALITRIDEKAYFCGVIAVAKDPSGKDVWEKCPARKP